MLDELQEFVEEKYDLPTSLVSEVRIDQLRLVRLKGNFAEHEITEVLRKPIVLETELLEIDRYKQYGVMTTGKWLSTF